MAMFTPRKCVRALLIVAFISFIVINFHFLVPAKIADVSPSSLGEGGNIRAESIGARLPRTTNITNNQSENSNPKPVPGIPGVPSPPGVNIIHGAIHHVADKKVADDGKAKHIGDTSSAQRFSQFNESLRFIINDINSKQAIRNGDKFPPNALNATAYRHVFAVQVHNRDHYLQQLVNSLKKTRDINGSLLIVSHDFYSREVFDIINSIDFMPVIQIFYPMCMQLYKNKYPGPDPDDCPRDIGKEKAKAQGCVNADYPDKYGHFREAAYSQTKLHWYWKLHYMFDVVSIMKRFQGYVTLIEEDHYVTPDSLYILQKMIDLKPTLCANCRIFTLGNYDKKPTYAFTNEIVVVPDFISSKHNMAMSLNRDTYELIKKYNKEFCNYDDYNWDWSLQHIGREVIPGKLPTMIVKTPRVYHIGDCGVHHKGKKCKPEEKVKPIVDRINTNKDKLFPPELKVGRPSSVTYVAYKKLKANGGWGDKRDHDLCSSFMS